jgi:hypothetical protein
MSQTYVPVALRRRTQEQDRRRCAYCQTQESVVGVEMQVDHVIPEADGGPTTEENLCLACTRCNEHKNARSVAPDPETNAIVRLFHPRRQLWAEHFRWSEARDTIIGLTPTGRATVAALQLNREPLARARRRWVIAGWHPPTDEPQTV